MATLSNEVKAFIVQALACFESPSKVVELVKVEFGVIVTRQQVSLYDPSNAAGKALSKKWVDLFGATREKFITEISNIPVANKAYRLRILNRLAERAETMKNYLLTAQMLEQAAKECGDAFTNRQKLEHSGPGGGAIETITMNKEEYKSARREMLEDDDC